MKTALVSAKRALALDFPQIEVRVLELFHFPQKHREKEASLLIRNEKVDPFLGKRLVIFQEFFFQEDLEAGKELSQEC